MGNKPEFDEWQTRLLDFCKEEIERNSSFADQAARLNPRYHDTTPKKPTKRQLEAKKPRIDKTPRDRFLEDIRNYRRTKKPRSAHSKYERFWGLEDVYAICIGSQHTPNELLWDSEYTSELQSLFQVFFSSKAVKEFLNVFACSEDNFLRLFEGLPDNKFFRHHYPQAVMDGFCKSFHYEERGLDSILAASSKKANAKVRSRKNAKLSFSFAPCEQNEEFTTEIVQMCLNRIWDEEKRCLIKNHLGEFLSRSKWECEKGDGKIKLLSAADMSLDEDNGNRWSQEKLLWLTLNMHCFICGVNTIAYRHSMLYASRAPIDVHDYLTKFFGISENEAILEYLSSLLKNSFVWTNQYTVYCFNAQKINFSKEKRKGIIEVMRIDAPARASDLGAMLGNLSRHSLDAAPIEEDSL